MLFGRTTTQWIDRNNSWIKTFAYIPRRLYDGRWAWLRALEVTSFANDDVDPDGTRTDWLDCWWVYRLPASNTREYI